MRKRPGRGQTKTWSTQDWIMGGKTRRSGRNKAKTRCGGRSPDAPDWNIPGGTSRRGRRPPGLGHQGTRGCQAPRRAHPGRNKEHGLPPDRIRSGQAAAERHGLDHPGWIKQHEPRHAGLDYPGTKGGQTPRTGTSREEQAAGATAPTTQKSRDTWWADAPNWSIWGRTRTGGHNRRGRGKKVCRPGQECQGRIYQKGSPPPGMECPGERGDQRRRKQEAKTKVIQRRRQDRKQRKGKGRGNAGRQRSGRGPGDAGRQR